MKWNLLVILILILFVVLGCSTKPSTPISPAPTETQTPVTPTPAPSVAPVLPPTESPKPTPTHTEPPKSTPALTPQPTLPPDTTPPSAITGLVAGNAYDGRLNLWWDKSTAADFDHYNIYLNKLEIADVTGMKAIQQINDFATCQYQATGLEDGTMYYFTVTALDKSGNESKKVNSVSATPTPMPRGEKEPDLTVDVYNSSKVWAGTTLLRDNHNPDKARIIEVNMLGEIVWQYILPESMRVAGDVELLPNDNILFTAVGGVYEIDRSGKVVWQYLTSKLDHDADRLPNGNTIFVFGMNDLKTDAQVTEVDQKGDIIWQWYARDYFDKAPYSAIFEENSWTHANAVIRLDNGNALVSLRNFDCVVEVDSEGVVVRLIGEGIIKAVHDPELLANGNLLAALPSNTPSGVNIYHAVEINSDNGKVIWHYRWPQALMPQGTRDTNRLPNGNTLVVGSSKIIEITTSGDIVWQFGFDLSSLNSNVDPRAAGFYKADRINVQR